MAMMRWREFGSPLTSTALVRSSATTFATIEPGSADLLVSLLSSVTSLTTSAAEAQERGTVTTLRSPALSTRSTMVSRRLMTAARPVISNTLEGS